ncbi:MinD-like ATPase involved in chromosome partitioning or flagellar assembly [Spinactinospora alkalitolerans]|uniref:MinD-like ATPase involved in chromosome partitioning or flagellar assembly n=1 Tax=Spinactinospora alkalitolerans TaxID=687207 RepID=A0A852U3M8_9ACTN|nr:AAA family ATPase [Spinactinospora alkalitolerans]NYE50828.1 MinD-like ATPase involved in chromosome partitioning or flagellar assembly [Spinactinospora alkalitolerans]
MTYGEHDGSEHPGARSLRQEHDRDAAVTENGHGGDSYGQHGRPDRPDQPDEPEREENGPVSSPADQWFGDDFGDTPIPPPPPYAQPHGSAPSAGYPPAFSDHRPPPLAPMPPPPPAPPESGPEEWNEPPSAHDPGPRPAPPPAPPAQPPPVQEPPVDDDLPEPEPLPPLDLPEGSPYRVPRAPSADDQGRTHGREPSGPQYPPGPHHPPGPRYEYPSAPQPAPGPHYREPASGPQYPPGPHYREPASGPQYPPGPGPQRPQPPFPPAPPRTGGDPFPAAGYAPAGHGRPEQGGYDPRQEVGQTAESLKAETLVRGRRTPPSSGWRKLVHSATMGLVHPGEAPAELRRRELVARARTHVAGGHHRVAVLSLKGGVGKTTTTVALGSTLASLRGDRVLAVDANPDRGTLSDKVRLETAATIRDLLNEKELIQRYADIRGFTSQAASRLEILASDRDPAVSEAFSEADYREVSRILEHFYSICLTDCGTGLLHSAMRGVLGLADQIVLVSTASVDGARSASATLDWLEAHEYGYLVRGAVVVLSMVRVGKSTVDLDRLEEHFNSRCRSVVRVPWDSHLEEGAEVDLDQLNPETRDSYLHLAATVGEAFAWPR